MTKTPRTDEQCCEASAEELCKAALEHYDYVSTKALEWSNQIPQAIRFWYLEKPRLERELAAARQREGEIRASVIEECAMMCDAVGARLSHGAGYACKIAAEEIRNSV